MSKDIMVNNQPENSSIENINADEALALNQSSETTTGGSRNIFRDTPIRYLGYANEIGESFRYQYPKYVLPSYVLAFGYCFADAISTGYQSYHQYHRTNTNDKSEQQLRIRRAVVGTLDTLLWQSLASVMIPGYVIHTIVKLTKYSLPKQAQIPIFISTWLPTTTGLFAIPFIVHPIDHSVDYALDTAVRPFYRHYL